MPLFGKIYRRELYIKQLHWQNIWNTFIYDAFSSFWENIWNAFVYDVIPLVKCTKYLHFERVIRRIFSYAKYFNS